MNRRHPRNAPGDFYVADGCCLACGVWEKVAAGLLEWDESNPSIPHCFVARQPETPDQVDAMVQAMGMQEVDCMRYAGSDFDVIRKLIAVREDQMCDQEDVVRQVWAEAEQTPPGRAPARKGFRWLRFWRRS